MISINSSDSETKKALNWLNSVDPALKLGSSSDAVKTKLAVEKFSTMKHSYILCFGALNDMSLAYLSKLGNDHLYGIDSTSKVYDMPYYTQIKYTPSPLDNTHFPECFFDALYSTNPSKLPSNVEGVKAFLDEAKRITSNGSALFFPLEYASRNNWKLFGNSGFSQQEIGEILRHAEKIGFKQAQKADFPDHDCILFFEFRLSKKVKINAIKQINIIVPSLGTGEGIDLHARNMKTRLAKLGIKANLYKGYDNADKKYITVIEYVPAFKLQFPKKGRYVIDCCQTQAQVRFWLEVSNILRGILRNPADFFRVMKVILFHFNYSVQTVQRLKTDQNKELAKHFLICRSNELAEASGFKNYTLMELPSFGEPVKHKKTPKELNLGSFGFATKSKNFDLICELAKRLGIKATIWMGASRMDNASKKGMNYIAQNIYNRYNSDRIQVRLGGYTEEQLIKGMRNCTHFISAQSEAMTASGSLRHMVKLGRSAISVNNYIARDAQVHRVKSLNEIDREYLERTTELTNLDDGLRYLIKILEHLDFSKDFK